LQAATGLSLEELALITLMNRTRLAEASNDTRPLSPVEFQRVTTAITKYRLRSKVLSAHALAELAGLKV
jgi:hypothetical protein